MTASPHTSRKLGRSIACALATAAIAVPLAQASGSQGTITEHSATQNRVDLQNAYGQPDPWLYPLLQSSASSQPSERLITEHSAGQNRPDLQNAYSQLDPWMYHVLHEERASSASSGPAEPLITENSANQNRLAVPSAHPSVSVAGSSPNRFLWFNIAIGVAGTLALTLLVAGAIFAVRRTRGRFAPAS